MPENSGSTSLTISVTHIKSLRICEVFKKNGINHQLQKTKGVPSCWLNFTIQSQEQVISSVCIYINKT